MKPVNIIETIPEMWEFWSRNGINTQNNISIIFKFYSAFDKESDNFKGELERRGYKVDRKSKRTMIFLKGYEISAEKTQIWSQDVLKNEMNEIESIAKQYSTILEGYFGADSK